MDFMGFVIVSSFLIPLIPTVVICIIYGLCEYISDGPWAVVFFGFMVLEEVLATGELQQKVILPAMATLAIPVIAIVFRNF